MKIIFLFKQSLSYNMTTAGHSETLPGVHIDGQHMDRIREPIITFIFVGLFSHQTPTIDSSNLFVDIQLYRYL